MQIICKMPSKSIDGFWQTVVYLTHKITCKDAFKEDCLHSTLVQRRAHWGASGMRRWNLDKDQNRVRKSGIMTEDESDIIVQEFSGEENIILCEHLLSLVYRRAPGQPLRDLNS